MPGHVLIAGVSTRAAAESAARAGFAVTALDAFADLDQHPSVRALSIPRDFGVPFGMRTAARAARTCPTDAVAYLSPFDNHPRIVRALTQGRTLWGNSPDALCRARNPELVRSALTARGLSMPRVRVGLEGDVRPERDHDDSAGRRWLVKPFASGGGARVREWRRGAVPKRAYLQEYVPGAVGSVVFVAAGGRAVPLGISRQLIGDSAFGAGGYRYCGSLLAPVGDDQFGDDDALVDRACDVAGVLAEALGLVGVNGADFVARRGVPHIIEVNPRWSASMEVVERAYGISVFGSHATACATGALPSFDLVSARRGSLASGRAVVFSRRDVIVGDTARWLDDEDVRDVPRRDERIGVGRPVCSVLATGCDAAACHAALVTRAARVYADMSGWA